MKKVIIVGAGVAGLTAGVYAKQSGFDVTIYEQHTIPGGASTSWRRKGYLFEGGLHWLTGSAKGTGVNDLWREIGALEDNVSIYNRDPFFTYEENGKTVCLYRDIDKLRSHLIELSPEDEQEISKLCKDVKLFSKMQMPIMDIKGVKVKNRKKMPMSTLWSMMPMLPRMSFYGKHTVKEYSERFKSPLIRNFLNTIIGPDNSATGMAFTMATFVSGDGGYPEGGSLAMAKRIAKKFEALGGNIVYGKAVDQVLVHNGVAKGVIIGGEQIMADAVIVTLDTLVAIDRMFKEPIREPWAEKMRKETIPSLDTYICLGVEADLSDLPESTIFPLEQPIHCGNITATTLGMYNYAGYKGYAPKDCTALTSMIGGDSYDFWKACKENGTYEAEKQKLAEAYIAAITKRYPKLAGKIAVWDVATPLTYERYLGSYKGSWMSVMGKNSSNQSYPSKPESIQQVYFAGQRLTPPGGLPVAAETGRKAVQYLCKDMDLVFQGKA